MHLMYYLRVFSLVYWRINVELFRMLVLCRVRLTYCSACAGRGYGLFPRSERVDFLCRSIRRLRLGEQADRHVGGPHHGTRNLTQPVVKVVL